MAALLYGLSALAGLALGSFLNVCIYRIPRKESLLYPGSHCPSCEKPVKFYDNIPVLSFLILGGKCRNCRSRISWRYPLVELATSIIFLLSLRHFNSDPAAAAPYAAFMALLLAISLIDLDVKIIPNRLVFPGIVTGGIFAALSWLNVSPMSSLIGFGVGGGLFYLIALLSRGGMGGGDIKLIALIGILVGWQGVLLTIMLASSMGALAGVWAILFLKKGRKDQIPFGPFLSLGTCFTIFFGEAIIRYYLLLW
ncbi:MAG: prepilin peptidase [bacterium]